MRLDSPDPKRSGLNANGSGLRSGLHLVGMGPSRSEVVSFAIVAVHLHMGGSSWGESVSVAVASVAAETPITTDILATPAAVPFAMVMRKGMRAGRAGRKGDRC